LERRPRRRWILEPFMKPFATCAVILAVLIPVAAETPRLTLWPAELRRALEGKDALALDEVLRKVESPQDRVTAILAVVQQAGSDADPGSRALAAYAIVTLDPAQGKSQLDALVAGLRVEQPRIRARAILGLGGIGPDARAALPALLSATKDEDGRVRAAALRALGQVGPTEAVLPSLLSAINDPEPMLRAVAAQSLARLGPEAKAAVPGLLALHLQDPVPSVRAVAHQAIEAIGHTVDSLVASLESESPLVRLVSVSTLARMGPTMKAAPPLITCLTKDPDPGVRAGAALALGKMGPDARPAHAALVHALKDPEPRVRGNAALALGLIQPNEPAVAPALAALLRDDHAETADSAGTALGNLGPAAESAVQPLIDLLRGDHPGARRRAIGVLARIGPAAKSATSALMQNLQDRDPVFRAEAARALVSAGPQPTAPVGCLIQALRQREDELDPHVRAWACLSLAQVGPPAADAVPALVSALVDDAGPVRNAAALALGQIGPAAIPALVQALDHLDPRVRSGAALSLGGTGTAGRRAMPSLHGALSDEDPRVRLAAAEALARIATSLQLTQDTRVIALLETTLQAMDAVPKHQPSAADVAAWQASVAQVRAAHVALKTVERSRFLDHLLHSSWFPWLALLAAAIAALVTLWTILLWLRPLTLLRIGTALRSLPRLRLPLLLGNADISIRGLLLLGFFQHRTRVLDAWVARHATAFRESYRASRTVGERGICVALPVMLDGQSLPGLNPAHLRRTFQRRRGCLLIWGEGGAGKTTLACQIGRWALAADRAERLCAHIMLPVVIEHDLDHSLADGRPAFTALTEAIRGYLQAHLPAEETLSEEFLDQLLRQRRILVIVDHLSETSPAARAAIRPGHADFPAHALIITSRTEEPLDGVPHSAVQPQRIDGQRLASFLESYLSQQGKRTLFDDPEYFEACRRLSVLVGRREITPLLGKLYADQLIAQKEMAAANPPATMPELMIRYVYELNRAIEKGHRRSDTDVLRDAQRTAWECVRQRLRSEPVSRAVILEALGGHDAATRLTYLEDRLGLVRASGSERLTFALDPLAEYLAAWEIISTHPGDMAFWRPFAARARQGDPDTTRTFLQALTECSRLRDPGPGILDLLDDRARPAA